MADTVLASPSTPGGPVVTLRRRPPIRNPEELASLGMWLALAPIAMLFLAIISAFVVRRGLGSDWVPLHLPVLVWWNTGVLLLSSVTLEIGRRALRATGRNATWAWTTFGLGVAFLAGQVMAWGQLMSRGVSMGATRYGSFFYVLTGLHAVHLVAGVAGLLAAALWPQAGWKDVSRGSAVKVAGVYWHFMDILWLGILLLLVLGR
jgi:cytochrome c oxidase subunit 3